MPERPSNNSLYPFHARRKRRLRPFQPESRSPPTHFAKCSIDRNTQVTLYCIQNRVKPLRAWAMYPVYIPILGQIRAATHCEVSRACPVRIEKAGFGLPHLILVATDQKAPSCTVTVPV